MANVGNWVGELSFTTGVGPASLGGAIAGFTTFASIGETNFWYAIVDGDNREAGEGTLSGGVLTRDIIYATLENGVYNDNSPTAISLSGQASIFSTFNKTAFDQFNNALKLPVGTSTGQLVGWNNTTSIWEVIESSAVPGTVPDGTVIGQILEWSGIAWLPVANFPMPIGAADGDIAIWSVSLTQWVSSSPSLLSNAIVAGTVDGQTLRWESDISEWIATNAINVADNGDVLIPNLIIAASDVGLGNVDNTSDTNKPISLATQSALDDKASAASLQAHVGDFTNPHAVGKGTVGLGNVDNTSDVAKPISTLTQAGLDGKADTIHTHVESDITNLDKYTQGQVDSEISGALTAHTSAPDPHPQYLLVTDLPQDNTGWFTDDVSSINASFLALLDDQSPGVESTSTGTSTVVDTPVLMGEFLKEPALTEGFTLTEGTFTFYLDLECNDVNGEVFIEAYRRTFAGVETLLGTSNNIILANNRQTYNTLLSIPGPFTFVATDSFVHKVFVNKNASGGNPLATLYMEGSTTTRVVSALPIATAPGAHTLTHQAGGVDELPHDTLAGSGSNTHAVIDAHIANVTTNPHNVTPNNLGLGSVDNTADTDKPVSVAQQTALDDKADNSALASHTGNVANPHIVTKTQVGLANVDNISDVNKPVSTAQQVEIDTKADQTSLDTHTGNTANPHVVSKSQVGLSSVDNTSDVNKPVSSDTQTALDAKATTAALSAHTGDGNNPHAVTKSQVGLSAVDNTSDFNKPISNSTQTALDGKQTQDVSLDQIAALVDPNADRILFWDDSINAYDWLIPGTNLSITDKTLNATGGGGSGDVSAVNAPVAGDFAKFTTPTDIEGRSLSETRSDLGISNIDNTSDAAKPVSSSQQDALNLKTDNSAFVAHTGDSNNPHSVTKTEVGLGSADNTSDANKPISSATQTALDGKEDVGGGGGGVSKNLLMNGAFQIWQRTQGPFDNITVGKTFTADRWNINASGGGNVDINGIVNDEKLSSLAFEISGNILAAGVNLSQRIESFDSAHAANKQLTISVRCKTSAATNLQFILRHANAIDDFSTVTTIQSSNVNVTAGGDVWETISFTFNTIPPNSANGLEIILQFNTLGAKVAVVTNIKLEIGTSVTAFEHVQQAEVLSKCSRYFQRVSAVGAAGSVVSFGIGHCIGQTTGAVAMSWIEKRIVPTLTANAVNQLALTTLAGTTSVLNGFNLGGSVRSINSGFILCTVVSTQLVAGDGTLLVSNENNTAYIDIDAELV